MQRSEILKLLSFLLFLSILNISCDYNPLGGKNSYIDGGNTPFLLSPYPFSFDGVLAKDGEVVLTWTESKFADDYSVVYGTSPNDFSLQASGCTAIKIRTCTIGSLTNGTTYYFKVIARNIYGKLGIKKNVALTPNPFHLKLANATNAVYISWPDKDGALGTSTYTLQYGTSPGVTSTIVPNITNGYLLQNLVDGQNYYLTVTISNTAGTITSFESSILVIAPPGTPTWNGTATVNTSTILVSWNAASGAGNIKYTVLRTATPGDPYSASEVAGCINITTLSCTDSATGLIPGNHYYYLVYATNEGGNSPNSSKLDVVTVPKVPANLIVQVETSSSNKLLWARAEGNADIDFEIYRSTTTPVPKNPTNKIGTVNSTFLSPNNSYIDSATFNVNTIYYYTVIAKNGSVSSAPAIESDIPSELLTAPSIINFPSVTSDSIDLTWNFATGNAPVIYNLYRSLQSNPTSWDGPIYTGSNAFFKDTNVKQNTRFYYKVSVKNLRQGAVSQFSNEYSVVTGLSAAPILPVPTQITSSSVRLNWDLLQGNGAVTYELYRATNSTGPWGVAIFSDNSATTFQDNGLDENRIYYYKITATNNAPGATAISSAAVQATTANATLPSFILPITNITADSAQISWNAAPYNGNVVYKLYRSLTGAAGSWSSPIYEGTLTTFTDNNKGIGLAENTDYFYKLELTNDSKGAVVLDSTNATDVSNVSITTNFKNAPTIITSDVGVDSVSIQWSKMNGTSNVTYNIYRATSTPVDTSGTPICANLTLTYTCTDSTVQSSSRYYYAVKATNSTSSISATSNPVVTLPNTPNAPTVTAIDGKVTITWVQSPGTGDTSLISYTVQRSRTLVSGYQDVMGCTNVSSASLTCTDIVNPVDGNPYYYTVRAKTLTGQSVSASPPTDVTPITPIVAVNVTVTPTQITLSWSGGNGRTTQTVYSSTTAAGSAPGNGGSSTGCATSPCNFPASSGQVIYYTIVASNANASTTSNEYVAVVHPSPLTTLEALDGAVKISWSAVAQATNYKIYYSDVSGQAVSGNQLGCDAGLSLNCTISGLINGQTYYFALVITRSVGGDFIGTEDIAVPIGKFDITQLVATGTSTAEINWSQSLGATSYDISYGTSSGNYTTTLPTVSASVVLPYAISGLKVGETFYFMVTAKNPYGSVRANQEKVLQTQAGVPTGLKITAATSTSLTLNWSTTGNPPVTYKVYRAKGVGAQFVPNPSTPVCTVLSTASPSNACTDTGLQPNTAYYYVMTATNSQGESDYSPVVDGVTALSALPTFNAATNLTDTSLTINWNALSGNGIVSYDLNRSTGANGPWTTAINAAPKTALSFADSGLTENTTYYYRLIATNNSINTASVTSENFSVTTNLKKIPVITNPAASVTFSSLILNWTHPGVNSSNLVYRVYRSETGVNNSWGSPINTPTLNIKTFSDSGLSANTKYFYKVTASNDGGVTEIASNNYDATTALKNAPKFVESDTLVTTTSVSLTWTQAEGVEPVTYKLYRSTTAGSWGTPILTSPTALTYTDSGLTPNTKYFYKITLTNNAPGATELSSSAYEVITDLLANPTFATTSSITATSMTINWNAYPALGATVTFKLYRSETGNGSDWVGPINTPSSSTSYNDTGLKQNTKYYYLLKANNNSLPASERSSASNLQQTTQISEKPILTTINIETTSATLQWESVKGNGNVTYSVYRSASLPVSTSGAAVCTNPAANTCTDSTLNSGNIYYYVLVANNTVNQTVSDPITITTTPPAPPAPTAVATDSTVVLTLSPVTGVTNPSAITYTVQSALVVGGPYDVVPGCSAVTASNLKCTDIVSVANGTTSYFYRVIANLTGASSSQPSATATVIPIAAFSPNPTVSSTATTITLSWVSPAGAATFEVYTSTVAGNSNPTTGGVLVPSCTSSPCTFPVGTLGQTVYYSVLAQNTTTNGVAKRKSNEVFVTPIQVNDIQVIAANSKATIQWSLVVDPNITNYTVYYATTAGGSLTSGKTLGCNAGLTATCDVTGLTNGQKYYFSLFVTRPVGGDFQSSEVVGTPVGNFAINSVTTTTSNATLIWQKSVGATKYNVSYGTQSGVYTSETIVNSTGAATESYTITGLNSGVLYYFYVSAQNADNGSVGATEEKFDVTVPISPNNFKVSQTDYNSVSLEFSNDYISVPLIYKIYRGASATFNVTDSGVVEVCAIPVTSSAQAVLNCKDENSPAVSENKIYYYRAVANTNTINGIAPKSSTPSSVVSGVTQFNAASSFAVAVKAGTLSAQSVTLTWTFDVGTEKIDYDVFQSSMANAIASGALISCTPVLNSSLPSATNQCVVNGLSENQRYYFAVRAKNSTPSGRTIISSDVVVVTQFIVGTTFPATLSSVTDGSATINWTFNIGSSNVDFVISSVVGGTSTALPAAQIATCTLTNIAPSSIQRSCNITGLSRNSNYKFTVQAVNKSTLTASTITSSVVDVITAFAPAATFVISVKNVNSGEALIQWTLGIGNSSVDYTVNINNVDISATNITGCTLTAQAPSATLNCKVSGLTLNTSQVISVKAKNGSIGTNSQITSNSVTAVTPFASTTSFTITNSNLTHNSVTLSWTLNVGSAGITYSIAEANNLTFSQSCSLTSIPPANTITCNITGLTENTNYTFNVTATGQATFPVDTGKKTITVSSAVLTKPFTAPTGLTATITGSGPSAIQLNWNLSSDSGLKYTVYVSENPTAVTTTSEKFCTNVAVNTCSNTQYAGVALKTAKTYDFIIVSENASGQSNSSSIASILFSPPINLTVPTITGIPASGIIQSLGSALTGGFGTWENTGAACTYRWYRNGLGITIGPNVTGTISAASPSTNYTTQNDDKCRVISFGVSCTNGLGTKTVFNAGLTFGINTQNIVTEYSGRVVGGALTTTGTSQIKGFLDGLIAKSIPLPDYFYAMRSYQNAGTGTKLYDLYCLAQDVSSIVYDTWDTRGILNTDIASQIATVPSVFSGQPSTIAAIAATPVFASSFRGVSGYAGGDSSVNTSFGYANVANALNVGSGIEASSVKSVPLLLPGLYDYFGFYYSRPYYGLKFANSFAQSAGTKNTFNATGGLTLGAYNNNPVFSNNGLNSFMPFAAAWTSTALTFPQQEDVRKAYYPTMGVGLHKFLYAITWEPNNVTNKDSLHRCVLNIVDGSIHSCSVVVAPFDFGTSVNVQQIDKVKKIYFSLFSGKLYLCSLDEINGTVTSGSAITDCTLIRNAINTNLRSLAIYAGTSPSTPTNMYIINAGKKIYNCSLNQDGIIVATPACLETSTSSFTGNLQGATVFKNYLYVGTTGGEALVCPINPSDGNLSTCTRTATDSTGFAAIGQARSIKFYDTGSTVFAYISNRSGNSIFRCTWDSSNGFLHTCSVTPTPTLKSPSGIFISKSLDNVGRIYITNVDNVASPIPYFVICQIINFTGALGSCSTTPTPFGIQSAEDIFIQDF